MADNLNKIEFPYFFFEWGINLTKDTLIRTIYNSKQWYKIKHLYHDEFGLIFIHPKYLEPPYQNFKPFKFDLFIPAELCVYQFGITRKTTYQLIGT